jgi:hypothetical protein
MKRLMMVAAIAAVTVPAMAAEEKFLERVEMEPRAVDGASVRQLTERARLCITQNVTNDAVTLKDTSRVNPMASIGTMTAGDSKAIDGGQVIQSVDLDGGLIVAQSRTSIPFMVVNKYTIQSTITFEAREGRFRITHTGIKSATQDTGYASNSGFQPVRVQTGSPYKKIEAALQDVSTKISDCVATAPSSDW